MKKKVVLFIVLVFIVMPISAVIANKAVTLTEYIIQRSDVPMSFDGFRIVHVSDLHNESFGEDNIKLVDMIKNSDPDIIVITGDIIDSRNTDISVAISLSEELLHFAPVYYVSGNHESRVSEYALLRDEFESMGVVVLENEYVHINRGEEKICIAGVIDPGFDTGGGFIDKDSSMTKMLTLTGLKDIYDEFVLLLSHRPEYFQDYVSYGVDIVFSGHAHGGQFRLPFVGGIIAPGQGIFPEYDCGVYTEEDTSMIVSRGLGNSIIPLRINNRPEVILVELKSEQH